MSEEISLLSVKTSRNRLVFINIHIGGQGAKIRGHGAGSITGQGSLSLQEQQEEV